MQIVSKYGRAGTDSIEEERLDVNFLLGNIVGDNDDDGTPRGVLASMVQDAQRGDL